MGLLYKDKSKPRLDRGLLWSIGLFLASFPLVLIFLALIGALAMEAGIELGSDEDVALQNLLNGLYMAAVLAVWVAAAVLGFSAWRRKREVIGLIVAILSVLCAVGFVALPSLAW